MLEMIHDGVTIRDSGGRLLQWNAAAERLLGLTPLEIDDWTSQDAEWSVIQPDGSPLPHHAWPGVEAQRTGVAVRDVIMGVNQANGDCKWLRVSSTPFVEPDGAVSATLTTFTDVTAIIESERDSAAGGNGGATPGAATAGFDRRRLEHAIELFDGALARMTATLEHERLTTQAMRHGVSNGRALSASIDEDGMSTDRDNLTSAIVDLEGARRAIRVQMFRALLSEGKSIGEIARIWGISRQLASRILRDAKLVD